MTPPIQQPNSDDVTIVPMPSREEDDDRTIVPTFASRSSPVSEVVTPVVHQQVAPAMAGEQTQSLASQAKATVAKSANKTSGLPVVALIAGGLLVIVVGAVVAWNMTASNPVVSPVPAPTVELAPLPAPAPTPAVAEAVVEQPASSAETGSAATVAELGPMEAAVAPVKKNPVAEANRQVAAPKTSLSQYEIERRAAAKAAVERQRLKELEEQQRVAEQLNKSQAAEQVVREPVLAKPQAATEKMGGTPAVVPEKTESEYKPLILKSERY